MRRIKVFYQMNVGLLEGIMQIIHLFRTWTNDAGLERAYGVDAEGAATTTRRRSRERPFGKAEAGSGARRSTRRAP